MTTTQTRFLTWQPDGRHETGTVRVVPMYRRGERIRGLIRGLRSELVRLDGGRLVVAPYGNWRKVPA